MFNILQIRYYFFILFPVRNCRIFEVNPDYDNSTTPIRLIFQIEKSVKF